MIDQLGAFHSDYMAHHDREAEPSMQSRNLEQKSKKLELCHSSWKQQAEATVSQFVCFHKLQVEAADYFNNPSCKTQCEERKTRKNSHKNPEIMKKEVSTNENAA